MINRIKLLSPILHFVLLIFLGCATSVTTDKNTDNSNHGGSPFFLKESRIADMQVGTMYINKKGLGIGEAFYPQIMRISVAQAGDVLYQLDFYITSLSGERLNEYPVMKQQVFEVGPIFPLKDNQWRGIVISGGKNSEKSAVLQGKVTIHNDFQASFTGQIVFADSSEIVALLKSGIDIDNKVTMPKQQLRLESGKTITIKENLIEIETQ